MVEGGYEENAQDDTYEESIPMHDLSQQTVYAEVESSVGDLNTQWKELPDSVIDDFYKQVEYEPFIKDYNTFEYKDSILFLIKKMGKNRIK